MPRVVGLAGLCTPIRHMLPGLEAACALCQDALHLCSYRIRGGQAPRLPREEAEGGQEARYAELDRRAHHPIGQRSTSLLVHHQRSPKAGAHGGGGITVAWGRRAGCSGVLRFGTVPAGWRPPLRPAPSCRLSKPVCLSVCHDIM